MAGFEEELLSLVDQMNATVDLSIDEKEAIANAGANIFKRDLENVVKSRHFRMRKTGRNPHLANSIRIKLGNRDGNRYGAVTVGWNNKKAHIANFINGGTRVAMVKRSPNKRDGSSGKKYRLSKGGQVAVRRDPFVDEVQSDAKTNHEMMADMNKKYQEIVQKRS